MKNILKNALAFLLLTATAVFAQNTVIPISQVPYGGLLMQTDQVVANRNGTTMRMMPFQFPSAGSLFVSNGTAAPAGLVPINGYCIVGSGSSWITQPCTNSGGGGAVNWPSPNYIVQSNGTDSPLGLSPINTDILIGNGSTWRQEPISADCTMANNGAITCTQSNGIDIATISGMQTLTNKSIDGSEINSGTVAHTYLPTGSSSAAGVLQCGTNTSCTAGTISVPAGSSSAQGALQCGSGVTCTAGTISVSAGSGVTSFTGDGGLISNSGSTGAVTTTLASATANKIWASPDGSSGAGSYRALVLPDLPTFTTTTASLGGDIALTNQSQFYDGPSAAQGTTGTFMVQGTFTISDGGGSGGNQLYFKTYDGTTTCNSGAFLTNSTAQGQYYTIPIPPCVVTNPAGNMRVAVENITRGGGATIKFNQTGTSKDSTIVVTRLH